MLIEYHMVEVNKQTLKIDFIKYEHNYTYAIFEYDFDTMIEITKTQEYERDNRIITSYVKTIYTLDVRTQNDSRMSNAFGLWSIQKVVDKM